MNSVDCVEEFTAAIGVQNAKRREIRIEKFPKQ
jgi:hypothetical protein